MDMMVGGEVGREVQKNVNLLTVKTPLPVKIL